MHRITLMLCLLGAGAHALATKPEVKAITLLPGAVISAEGDSLTYGQDTASPEALRMPGINGAPQTRSLSPYPEALAKLLRVTVINRGFPGDQTAQGLERWKNAAKADLVILMYGTNDWGNFGGNAAGPVSVATYKTDLTALIRRHLDQGSKVMVVSPPPVDAKRVGPNGKPLAPLNDYVKASKAVTAEMGVPWIDSEALLKSVKEPYTDGLHLSATMNQALARYLASVIKVSW